MIIQFPLYLIYEKLKTEILKINVDFTRFGNEPITFNSMRTFIGNNIELKLANPNKQIKRNFLIKDLTEHNLITITSNSVVYKLFEINFILEDFIFREDHTFKIFDIYNKPHDITPTIIDTDINTVKFQILEKDFNNLYNATLTSPIILQILETIN